MREGKGGARVYQRQSGGTRSGAGGEGARGQRLGKGRQGEGKGEATKGHGKMSNRVYSIWEGGHRRQAKGRKGHAEGEYT